MGVDGKDESLSGLDATEDGVFGGSEPKTSPRPRREGVCGNSLDGV